MMTKRDLELLAHGLSNVDVSDEAWTEYQRRVWFHMAPRPMMTREHWTRERFAAAVAAACSASNPRFNRERFMTAAMGEG